MPQSWLRLSNGTPPQLEPYIDDPAGLKEFVESVLSSVRQVREEEAQTELIDLYFEVGRPVAYALVRGLDDPITMKAVCRTLGAEGFTKLLTVEQATLAVDRDRAIRTQLGGEPGPDSTSATERARRLRGTSPAGTLPASRSRAAVSHPPAPCPAAHGEARSSSG